MRVRNLNRFSEQLWGPWEEFHRLQGELDRLFDGHTWFRGRSAAFPPVNVYTNDEGAVVTAQIPGASREDIRIQVEGRTLTLQVKRPETPLGEGAELIRGEIQTGDFTRALTMPFEPDVDAVEASYTKGVLEIRLPKEPKAQPRRIAVEAAH